MILTTAQKAALLKALRDLLHYGPRRPTLGICWHLDNAVSQHDGVPTYSFVASVSIDWPGRTGEVIEGNNGPECNYPIRRPLARDKCGMWAGEQLVQRTALIQFLIGYLEGSDHASHNDNV